jgi:hypothetical protein
VCAVLLFSQSVLSLAWDDFTRGVTLSVKYLDMYEERERERERELGGMLQ